MLGERVMLTRVDYNHFYLPLALNHSSYENMTRLSLVQTSNNHHGDHYVLLCYNH